MSNAIADPRYRIAVFLSRSDRPETIKWHCPRCRQFVAEITGGVLWQMRDVTDLDENIGVQIRCSGNIDHGVKCHTWYSFILGER